MDISSSQISHMVFQRVTPLSPGEFSLDSQMLAVLMELDGRQSLAAVAKKMGINIAAMREIVFRLLRMKLIEPVEEAVSKVDEDFMDYLRSELAVATGPIAQILIEEGVRDLGCTMHQFPAHRAAELVDLLAKEIHRDEKMVVFKEHMVNKIKEKGY